MDSNIDIEGRNIYLYDIINDEVSINITKWMKGLEDREPRDPINLYINTQGGSVQHFLSIYDVMRSLDCDVNTIGSGYCMSGGALLLLSGTGNRKAYRNTAIMLHEMQTSIGYRQFTDVDIKNKWLKSINNKIKNIIAEHTNKSLEQVKKDMKRDLYLDTEKARDYGIIDEII